jgi:hypothetical protein
MARLVEQEPVVHLGEFPAGSCQVIDTPDPARAFAAARNNEPAQFGQPFALFRSHRRRQLQVDRQAEIGLQMHQSAQRRHGQAGSFLRQSLKAGRCRPEGQPRRQLLPSASSSKPTRRVRRCPARLPLSTVDTYEGGRICRVRVSYQL